MNQLGNIITHASFGQPKYDGHAQIQSNEDQVSSNVLMRSQLFSSRNAIKPVEPPSLALKVFEFTRAFERVLNADMRQASHAAALSAKLSIHAQELAMSRSMLLAQRLGEHAMSGDIVASEAVKLELCAQVPSELTNLR